MTTTRREFLVSLSAAAVACAGPKPEATDDSAPGDTSPAGDSSAPLTCGADDPIPDPCEGTPPVGEGPYYRADVPERTSLNTTGETGYVIHLRLRLLDEACAPVAGAKVVIWQADQAGEYDNETDDYNWRGYTTTGEDGSFCFETLRPPPYTDGEGGFQPAHYHLKFIIDGVDTYTTQLYFTDDPWFELHPKAPQLIVTPEDDGTGTAGTIRYTFVLGWVDPNGDTGA